MRPRKGLTLMKADYPMPASLLEFALREHMPDPRLYHGEFVDYWLGRGEMKADWEATERNWLRLLKAKGRPVMERPKPKVLKPAPTRDEEVFDPTMPAKIKQMLADLAKEKSLHGCKLD